MKFQQMFLCIVVILLLSGCKIEITVPAGARVVTESGTYVCEPGDTCIVDVVDIFFDEKFSIEFNVEGVTYAEWRLVDRGLCGGIAGPCRIFTSFYAGNSTLISYLENDQEIFYMEPGLFRITSPEFGYGGEIPMTFTCDSSDRSPEIRWSGVPRKTRSLALILDDPDAPGPIPFTHWLVYNIQPETTELSEGIAVSEYPEGALSGINDFGQSGYGGPCPPSGTHRYFFTLYALDKVLPDLESPTVSALEDAIADHILAESVLMGTYSRP